MDFTRLLGGNRLPTESATSGPFPEGAVLQLGCVPSPSADRVSAAWQIRCTGGLWKATFLRCDEGGNILLDSATPGGGEAKSTFSFL